MTRIQSHLALVLLPAALASCSDNLFCVDDLAPGIVVSVHDAVTAASITPLARGEIRSGTFSDSLVA